MLLHGNLSLFSCQGAEICSHGAFPPGNACLDSKQNLESGRGTLKLTKSKARPKTTIATCGRWSERLVIQDPATAANEYCP